MIILKRLKKTEKIMKRLWQICEIEVAYPRDGQFLSRNDRHNQKMRVLFLHPEVQIFRDCRPMNFLEYFGFKLFLTSINAKAINFCKAIDVSLRFKLKLVYAILVKV